MDCNSDNGMQTESAAGAINHNPVLAAAAVLVRLVKDNMNPGKFRFPYPPIASLWVDSVHTYRIGMDPFGA